MRVYNDEFYHHGVLGMKWSNHKAKVQAKKESHNKQDSNILLARKNRESTLADYNKKANYANDNPKDVKAQQAAANAYIKAISTNAIANQKTHKERNKQKVATTLTVVGTLGLSIGAAALGKVSR